MRLHPDRAVLRAWAGLRRSGGSTAILALAVLLHVAAKWPILVHDHGIYWPDEIFESIEMAHWQVFGFGLLPWEFIDGARNWAFPLLLTLPMRVGNALGGGAPLAYLLAIRITFVALTVLTAAWIVRGAREQGATATLAALAAASFLLSATTLYFSHRALSENAAQLPALAGLVLLGRPARRRRDLLLGASALGLATLMRLQLGLLCAVVLVFEMIAVGRSELIATRPSRSPGRVADLGWMVVMFALWALAYGALDAWTYGAHPAARWGGWFHSARVYLAFNTQANGAAFWGVAPPYYYGLVTLRALEGLAVVLALGTLLAWRQVPLFVSSVVVFVLVHSLIPHKELRFILPMAPIAWTAAAIGLSRIARPRWRTAAIVALVLTTALSFANHRRLTMRDIGAYPDRRDAPAWDDFGSINRLLLVLSAQPALCGLAVDAPLSWTGGLSYLHRPVPMYGEGMPQPPGAANFAIARADRREPEAPGETLTIDGGYAIRRLHDRPCASDIDYDWTLK